MASSKKTPRTKKPKRRTWRDTPEHQIPALLQWMHPESLHVGPHTVERAVDGDLYARAIVDAYAFRLPLGVTRA